MIEASDPRTDEDWAKVILTTVGAHITTARVEAIAQILEDRDAACARHVMEIGKCTT